MSHFSSLTRAAQPPPEAQAIGASALRPIDNRAEPILAQFENNRQAMLVPRGQTGQIVQQDEVILLFEKRCINLCLERSFGQWSSMGRGNDDFCGRRIRLQCLAIVVRDEWPV